MGSFLNFLSPALTVGTQAVAAHQQGKRAGEQEAEAKTLRKLAEMRQANLDAQNKALADAQMANYKSLDDERRRPKYGPFEEVLKNGQRSFVQRSDSGDVRETPYAPIPKDTQDWDYQGPTTGEGAFWVNPKTQERRPIAGSKPLPRGDTTPQPRYEIRENRDGKFVRVRVDGPEGEIGVDAPDRPDPVRRETATETRTNKQRLDLKNVKDAIATYRANLQNAGTEILPGAKKNLLQNAYTDLRLKAKDYPYGMGAPQAGDIALLGQALADPTSLTGELSNATVEMGGRAGNIMKALDQFEQMVDNMAKNLPPEGSQERVPGSGGRGGQSGGKSITRAEWSQLSPSDQAYFKAQGYSVK